VLTAEWAAWTSKSVTFAYRGKAGSDPGLSFFAISVLDHPGGESVPHPLSIKGVVIHDDHVLLLRNERGEWDLPGGRPEPGEDHRAALKREVLEETGLDVEVGGLLGEHLFEVLPGTFVRIAAYACRVVGATAVTLSPEHLGMRWMMLAGLAERIDGYRLPAGYLGAIRQAMRQPRSSHDRVV
jgi:8-oxo-dGTP pyrophosphatase MutT (NUDIX family)